MPGQVGLTTDVGRIEKLSFQVQRPSHDLLSEARASYAAGNYAKAIVYLFSYQLVHLDRNHLVRLAKGKTNRQYLREVRAQADIVRIVGETMTVFEDVLFGRHTIDRRQFEACWNRLDEFHQCVQKAGTMLVMVALLLVGCSKTTSIDDTYGRRRAADGGNSVNGTRVLARMFEEAGNRVSTARRLSDRLDDADVIVWAPDDFEPPTVEQREFLENWLWEQDGRTLVYIGRDFDAALVYWAEIASRAPPEHALEIKRRLALKQSEHDAARRSIPQQENCGWFFSR